MSATEESLTDKPWFFAKTLYKARARINGATLVNSIDLSVGRGELVVIVGSNGIGKSTILRRPRPTRGIVNLMHADLRSYSSAQLATHRATLS